MKIFHITKSKTIHWRCAFDNSIYFHFLCANSLLLLSCALCAIFYVLLTYPGILYTDSYARISMAQDAKNWFHAFSIGKRCTVSSASWLTIVPSFFICLSEKLTGGIALYTFWQAFFFFTILVVFSIYQAKQHKKWVLMCIFLTPVFAAFSIFYEASVGCITAIMAILLLLWKWEELNNTLDKAVTIGLMFFSSYVAFGYRANAFSILPALFLVIVFREKKWRKIMLLGSSILAGFILQLITPWLLHVDTMSSYATGFLWETVSTIQDMSPSKQKGYLNYLDDVFGAGVTQTALQNNYDTSVNGILWGTPFTTGKISEPEITKQILEKYFHLICSAPRSWLKTKSRFISNTIGFRSSLPMVEYFYNRDGKMSHYHFNDSRQRSVFVDYFLAYMEGTSLLFGKPWLMFLISLILLLLCRRKINDNKRSISISEAAFLIALFYYAAFVLNTQSFEFRYFFPAWCLLFSVIIATVLQLLSHFQKFIAYTLLPILLLLILLWGTHTLCRTGDNIIGTLPNSGELLYQQTDQKVYYMDGSLYFVADQGADTGFLYYVQWDTTDGETVVTDFCFDDARLYTSPFGKKVAVQNISLQNITSLSFGQCYNGIQFWDGYVDTTTLVNLEK